jgi:tellurium resistance protein TerD
MVNLQKGQNIPLDKADVNQDQIQVGIGWDQNTDSTIKNDIDIDIFALIVDASTEKGLTAENLFYYGNVNGKNLSSDDAYRGLSDKNAIHAKAKELLLSSPVVITKDNRDGKGDGDDETLFINASLLPKDKKAIIVSNIYEADKLKQTFGMVKNAQVNLKNTKGAEEIRYDLGEDFSIESGVIIAELYWSADGLKIKAIGKGFTGDVNELSKQYT